VNDGTDRVPRLVVGISRSPASWWALAWAVGEARKRRARLLLVHVFRPPVTAPAAAAGLGMPPTSRDLYADRVADGNALIRTAIDHAVGWMPGDVAVEQQAFPGRPAVELASVPWGGDLLVLGSRHRGWLRRLAPGSVARSCARRADCPVVIVPEPSPSVLQASLSAGPARVPRFRWVPRRGARTAS
jgi:nucleotide-binding universal stress UspA family protein